MPVTNRDSIDKIVTTYFAAVTKEAFVYKDQTYHPKLLQISPLLFRGFTCPEFCGACCHNVTLDYLPSETHPYHLTTRNVILNNKTYLVWTDWQNSNSGHFCKNLTMNGRCSIYEARPFPCDFELIKFMHFKDSFRLTQQLYGRKWALQRVDKKCGTKCEMLPATQERVAEVVRKLQRLKDWTEYFELNTYIDDIIAWSKTNPSDSLNLNFGSNEGFFS